MHQLRLIWLTANFKDFTRQINTSILISCGIYIKYMVITIARKLNWNSLLRGTNWQRRKNSMRETMGCIHVCAIAVLERCFTHNTETQIRNLLTRERVLNFTTRLSLVKEKLAGTTNRIKDCVPPEGKAFLTRIQNYLCTARKRYSRNGVNSTLKTSHPDTYRRNFNKPG